MWMPIRRESGEGSTEREEPGAGARQHGNHRAPIRSMNRMLKGWRKTGRAEQFRARIVNYADDFVILSRGKAAEALGWTRGVLERLGLTLNEKKTSLRNARRERFDFLGYTFGPHFSGRTGREYLAGEVVLPTALL
jgi:RNA-directed DNA polymerase